MVAERSFELLDEDSMIAVDDYVYLGGVPVAVVLGQLDNRSGHRIDDLGAACSRRNELRRCGMYHVLSDYQGTPIVTFDPSFQVSGVGEFDLFGHRNRRRIPQAETSHPFSGNQTLATDIGVGQTGDLDTLTRLRVSYLDADGTGPWLWTADVKLADGTGSLSYAAGTIPNMVTNFHSGNSFTAEFVAVGNVSGHGAVVETFEYERVGENVERYFPPLRFPGQYFDEETDYFENWNRYYDPENGRYLAPEPLLQSPVYLRRMAHGGMSVPTYAYAANNPLRYVDPDGLSPKSRLRLIKDFRFWVDFMTRHHLRRMPPLLNNFNATSPFRKELGCGDQADWLRRRLAEEGPYEDFQIGLAGGRTSSSGAWPHQWIVAVSTVDNSVLALDPWADRVTESPWFDNADTYDWDLSGGNYPDAMGGPWESVPTYGPWPSSSSEASPWW